MIAFDTSPSHALTFDQKVARKEAFKASQLSENPDPDLLQLRKPALSKKGAEIRKRFHAWRKEKNK